MKRRLCIALLLTFIFVLFAHPAVSQMGWWGAPEQSDDQQLSPGGNRASHSNPLQPRLSKGGGSTQKQERRYFHWIPLVRQEKEPATPVQGIGIIYIDPNGDVYYKDLDGDKTLFGGPNYTVVVTNINNNLAIDGNVIYVDTNNDTVGFFTTTPAAEAGIQYSDKFVICGTFTNAGVDACIDALGSEGGTVYLPEGQYLWSTQVYNTTAGITIQGAGYGTEILVDGNQSWGLHEQVFDLTGKGCVVRDLRINGQDVAFNSDTPVINLGRAGLVENVYFYKAQGSSCGLASVNDYGQVRGCTFDDCGNAAGGYLLAAHSYREHILFTNNVFHDNTPFYADIGLINADNCLVSHNLFHNEAGTYDHYAILVVDSTDYSLIANNLIYNVPNGINVTSVESLPGNISITGNSLNRVEGYAIAVQHGQVHSIRDNYIYGTDPNGTDIYINTELVQITGNFICGDHESLSNVPQYGIFLGSDARSVSVSANTIKYHDVASVYGQHCSDIQISDNQFAVQNFASPPSTTGENYIYMDANCENIGIWGNDVYDPNNAGPMVNNSTTPKAFQINNLHLWTHQDDTLADNGTVNLPDATDGMVFVSITDPNTTFTDESGMWMVTNTGVVTKVSGTANTDAADTDGDLCVYDGGTYGIIKNRLGGTGILRAFYFYQ